MSKLKLKIIVLLFIIGTTLSFSKEKSDKVNNADTNMEHLDESTQEIIDDSSKIDEEIIDEQENKSANENLKPKRTINITQTPIIAPVPIRHRFLFIKREA